MSPVTLVVVGVCFVGFFGVGSLPLDSPGEHLAQDTLVKRGGGGPFRPRPQNPFQYLRYLVMQYNQLQWLVRFCNSELTLARQSNEPTQTAQTDQTTEATQTDQTTEAAQTAQTTEATQTDQTTEATQQTESPPDKREVNDANTADIALDLSDLIEQTGERKRQIVNRFTVGYYISIYNAGVMRLWGEWRRCAEDLVALTSPQGETTPDPTTEGEMPSTTEDPGCVGCT